MTWTQWTLLLGVLLWRELRLLRGVLASSTTTTVQVTVGHEAELPCTVDFSGSPMVMWMDPRNSPLSRNDVILTDDRRFSVDHPYNDEWNLLIDGVRASDEGNYTCLINASPVQRKYVTLETVSAPTIAWSSPDVDVETGSDVTLQCHVDGKPSPVITWYRYSYTGERYELGKTGANLTMSNVSRYDAAVYHCEAKNGILPDAGASIKLDVKFAPIISLPHQVLSQEAGRDTFLQCRVNSHPHQDAHWEKEGVRVTPSDKFVIRRQDTERYNMSLFLFIYSLSEEDFGTYTCVASNQMGNDSGSVQLYEWHSGKAKVVIPPQDAVAPVTSDLLLTCLVDGGSESGQTDYNLVWSFTRDSRDATSMVIFESHPSDTDERPPVKFNSNKYEIIGHYDLRVKNLSHSDAGRYTCELSGQQNYSAMVTVVDDLSCVNRNDIDTDDVTEVAEGSLMALSCVMTFSGSPRFWETEWRHRHLTLSAIKEDSNNTVKRSIAFPVYAKDSGTYTCLLSVPLYDYKDECHINVTVTGDEDEDDKGKDETPGILPLTEEPTHPDTSLPPSHVSSTATPLPAGALCKPDPWNVAIPTLVVIVASCVGGTALFCTVIVLCVRGHYRRKMSAQQKIIPVTPNIYEANRSNGNGTSLEATRLTSDMAEDEV